MMATKLFGRFSRNIYSSCNTTTSKNNEVIIDLRSDTVTSPTQAMREAIATTPVGDDVYDEDPTVKILQNKMAKLLNKEASLFVPSGTMSNLIATGVHCHKRGSEAYLGNLSHIILYEQSSMASLFGVQTYTLKNHDDGTFDLTELEKRIIYHDKGNDFHSPIPSMICIENTHANCGGKILSREWTKKLSDLGKELQVPIHLDGARLFNASVKEKLDPSAYSGFCDSVSVCLSKGVGAPIGSILAGSQNFIEKAKRVRKALGGAMRQVGVIAAPALVGLETLNQRLEQDHQNAKIISQGIMNTNRNDVIWVNDGQVETNIILVQVNKNIMSPIELCEKLFQIDSLEDVDNDNDHCNILVKALPFNDDSIRLVTHSNVSQKEAQMVANKFKRIIASFS